MYPKDKNHTSFRMPLGVYCCTVMLFALKNAGATYQHAMNTIFYEHICKTVERYVDDIIVKSRDKGDHLAYLKSWHHAGSPVEDDPTKSFLGVASGKLLGFVVTSKGIHLDLEKICVIQEMQPTRNLKELRGLQGWLAYIQRFISNLSRCCQLFTKLMKKRISFSWNNVCQEAFEEIKEYLTYPHILVAPVSEKPFPFMLERWIIPWELY